MPELVYKTLRENVVTEIKKKILSGALRSGERIIEQNLSDEFGVSRGPIREALRQLEQEGLVEYTRNAGCSVKKIDFFDIYEIYLLRSNYEMLSVELCDGKFSDEALKELEEIVEKMSTLNLDNMAGLTACDNAFHSVIVKAAGFERIFKAWNMLSLGSLISSNYYRSGSHEPAVNQCNIHNELFEVIKTGNKELIKQEIYNHYMKPVEKLLTDNNVDISGLYFYKDK